MRIPLLSSALALTLVASVGTACTPPPAPDTADEKAPEKNAESPKQGDEAEKDGESRAEPAETPAAEGGGDYQMPEWFSENIVEHAAVIQQQRTDAEADGSFKAFILFEMKAEETAESCIEKFKAKLPADLGMGDAPPPPGPEGRLQILGSTDAFEVSVLCGEAKGKNSAILNFNKKPTG
jgi:hypothetical protein